MKPIIPRKNYIELIDEMGLDDFFTVELKCLKYTSGNISLVELLHITTTMKLFRPNLIMEFGTFNGRTTLNMALNCDAQIYTVDLPRKEVNRTKFPLESKANKNGLDETGYVGIKYKLWQGQDTDLVRRINQIWSDTAKLDFLRFKNKIDFLFIDASHSYENCLNDSYNGHKIINEHGIIFWHDYNGWPGVTQALNEYYEKEGKPEKMYWFECTSLVGRFF